MKTVSDDLFRLVKSLNKSEKGYFKKFAAKNASGSKQNYIILFDAVEAMDHYDEDELRRKLKNEQFVKQLPVYKVYLFNLILKSLHHYGSYDNAESQLTEILINAKTLVSKKLYKEARKLLKKAKAIAYKYDKIKFLFEILSTERHIVMQMPEKDSYKVRSEIYAEQKELYEKMKNFYEYSWLCDQMTIIIDNEADYMSPANTKKINEIMSSPYMTGDKKPEGYYAQMNYYHTNLVYSGSKNDTAKIFHFLKKGIEHAESNKHFIEENPQNYVFALINYLLYCSYAKKKKEEAETLSKLNTLRHKLQNKIPRETEIQIFYHSSNVELVILERNGFMKRGRIKAKQIEEDLKNYKNDISLTVKALLHINLASFYFVDEDYESSLKQINNLLNDNTLSLRSDVYEFAKIFQLIIHYELGNYDLLEYLTDSVNKFFKQKKDKGKKDKLIVILIWFFSSIGKSRKEEEQSLFDELLFKLKKYYSDPDGDNSQGYFDFLAWSHAKANNRKLVDIIKEKAA